MRAEQNKTLEFHWYYKRKFSGPLKKNTPNYETMSVPDLDDFIINVSSTEKKVSK